MSIPRKSPRRPSPSPSPQRQLPTGWRALVIGITFGFSAGFLFTIGIISLINANSTSQAQTPVGNSAASASATPLPTSASTPSPDSSPISSPSPIPSPSPISAVTPSPLPLPTPTSTADTGSKPLFAPNEVTFYTVVTIIFLILSAIVLLRPSGKK